MSEVAAPPPWRDFESTPLPLNKEDEAQIVIVGGGPVGLTLALNLGRRGHNIILLNRLSCIPSGSKAICFSKHSLEILDRLGVGQALVDKGVTWETGKVFWGESQTPVYEFDLLPLKHQKRPAFINLQQYRVEEALVTAVGELPNVQVRWGHEAVDIVRDTDGVTLDVSTDAGTYSIRSQWLAACDGSRSPVRQMLKLDFDGRGFEDRFLIADIRMDEERPAERWFWFDPPFNPGCSALLHRQPDHLWRLDFQLDRSLSTEDALKPETIDRLVRGMLGADLSFETVWTSVYKFRCCRLDRFVHGRVLFAGDAAHIVSPFGARGCNGGIADAANLGWKLDLVLRNEAGAELLESYDEEATIAAEENIQNSTRATDFIGPSTMLSRAFRNAVLELARDYQATRPWVNSGRLAAAVDFGLTSLATPDIDDWDAGIRPGSPAIDAPFGTGWLLDQLPYGFVLLARDWVGVPVAACTVIDITSAADEHAVLIDQYALKGGSAYLIRPDRYVAARWRSARPKDVNRALRRARGETKHQGVADLDRRISKDALFEQLVRAHDGLDAEESEQLNRRLVLMLLEATVPERAAEILAQLRPR